MLRYQRKWDIFHRGVLVTCEIRVEREHVAADKTPVDVEQARALVDSRETLASSSQVLSVTRLRRVSNTKIKADGNSRDCIGSKLVC